MCLLTLHYFSIPLSQLVIIQDGQALLQSSVVENAEREEEGRVSMEQIPLTPDSSVDSASGIINENAQQ